MEVVGEDILQGQVVVQAGGFVAVLSRTGHLDIVVLLEVDSGSPLRPKELLLTLILARRLSPAQSPDLLKEVPGLVLSLLVLWSTGERRVLALSVS